MVKLFTIMAEHFNDVRSICEKKKLFAMKKEKHKANYTKV